MQTRSTLGSLLCAVAWLDGCGWGRAEQRAAGQPTMNELMHWRADSTRQHEQQRRALMDRARALTPGEARKLFLRVQQSPAYADLYWTLVRHYEHRTNIKDLNALRLWYIEHHPGGTLPPGNINPRFDRVSYERGKTLWLKHTKQPSSTPDIFWRAADFLEGGDKPLVELVLRDGQRVHPNDAGWSRALGRHYAQVLLGSAEPPTEYNVFRTTSDEEARSPYALDVRARLTKMNDVGVLAHTAQHLLAWWRPSRIDAIKLARTCVERALAIDPNSVVANKIKWRMEEHERQLRARRITSLPPDEFGKLSESERMLGTLILMSDASFQQKTDEAAARAREVLDYAGRNRNDALYGEAVYEANIVLGKAALRGGKKKEAAHFLLAAAAAPGSDWIQHGRGIEMNLPRALADWGERSAVAQFLERMAPKTGREEQFKNWAADIRRGINPDLFPTSSSPTCTNDPC